MNSVPVVRNPLFAVPLLFVASLCVASLATFALPFAGPRTLMAIQFVIATTFVLAVSLLNRAQWPKTWIQYFHLAVSGLLTLALPFLGLYAALDHGVGTAKAALVVSLAPLLIATGATIFLGHRFVVGHWAALALAITGVGYFSSVGHHPGDQAIVFAPICIAAGALYHTRFCARIDGVAGAFIQLLTAAIVALGLAWLEEGFSIVPHPTLMSSAALLALASVLAVARFTRAKAVQKARINASDIALG